MQGERTIVGLMKPQDVGFVCPTDEVIPETGQVPRGPPNCKDLPNLGEVYCFSHVAVQGEL